MILLECRNFLRNDRLDMPRIDSTPIGLVFEGIVEPTKNLKRGITRPNAVLLILIHLIGNGSITLGFFLFIDNFGWLRLARVLFFGIVSAFIFLGAVFVSIGRVADCVVFVG